MKNVLLFDEAGPVWPLAKIAELSIASLLVYAVALFFLARGLIRWLGSKTSR